MIVDKPQIPTNIPFYSSMYEPLEVFWHTLLKAGTCSYTLCTHPMCLSNSQGFFVSENVQKNAVFWLLRFFIILKHPKEVSSRQFLTFPILWFSSIVMIIFFETMKTGKNHTSDIAFWKIGRKILIWTYLVFSKCSQRVSSLTIPYSF